MQAFEPGELDWVEKAALENLKGRITTADNLAKEAGNTLTVLLAGAGGSLAYAIKLLDESAKLSTFVAMVAGVWFTVLSILLVWKCLTIQSIPAIGNEPANVLGRPPEKTFQDCRTGELATVQERIDRLKARNNLTAKNLNIVRLLAAISPVIALICIFLYKQAVR